MGIADLTTCPKCDGSGHVTDEGEQKPCQFCHGKGLVTQGKATDFGNRVGGCLIALVLGGLLLVGGLAFLGWLVS
jgi:hypothetical protein